MHVEVTCAANVQPVVCTQGVFGLVCVCVRGGRSDQGILGGPSGRRIGNLTLHSKIPCTTRSMPASSGVKEYHGCRMALIQDLAVVRCGCAVQDVEMGKLRAREQWAHRRAELLHAHVSELQASSPTEISDAAAVAPLRKQISCLHTLLLHCAPSFTLGYVHDSELYTRLDSAESTTVALRSQVGDLMSANDRLASSLLALRNGNGNSNGNGNVMPHEHMYPPLGTLSPCHMYPPLDTLSPCHMYPPLDTLSPCHSTLPWTHFLLATVPSLGHTFSLPYLSFNEVGSVPRRVLPACSPLQLPYNIANVDEVVRNNGKQARTRVCAARAW